MIISPFDTIDEVNAQLTACKQALLDIKDGKQVRLNTGGSERIWTGEDLDKLQNHIVWLSKERTKFLKRPRSASVYMRPAR